MKKLVYIPAAAGVLAFGGIVFANTGSEQPATDPVNSPSQNIESQTNDQGKMLTFDEISAKALELANGTITDIELDDDDGRTHYDVNVDFEDYEYDFDFDAYSGELLKQEREKEDDRTRQSSSENSSQEKIISEEEAIDAAIAASEGGTVEEVELDRDDGKVHFEIEIKNGQTEHELSVDAYDGSILEHETDQDDDDDN